MRLLDHCGYAQTRIPSEVRDAGNYPETPRTAYTGAKERGGRAERRALLVAMS
jgi:hypothetical protein